MGSMKHFVFIIFCFFSLGSFAQQGLQMDFGEVDSTELALHRQIEYFELINCNTFNPELMGDLKFPEYKFEASYTNPYTLNLSFLPQYNYSSIGIGNYNLISPFTFNASVLSSAAYSLGDKVVFGGFSYGANSIMSAPLPNQAGRGFDNYGSTMFFQYKVSKNFKIETRVSVQQGNNGPLPPGF